MIYFGDNSNGNGNTSRSANYLRGCLFYCSVSGTLTELGVNLYAGATGKIRLGVYRLNSAFSTTQPGPLLLDAGEITNPATGWNTISGLSLAVQPGYYWLALVANMTATFYVDTGYNHSYRSFTYAALPDPFGTYAGSYPRICMRAGVTPSDLTDTCDALLTAENGSNDDVITDAIAQAGCLPNPSPGYVGIYPTSGLTVLQIEESASHPFSGKVVCGGVERDLSTGTRGIRNNHSSANSEMIKIAFPPASGVAKVSCGFFFKTTLPTTTTQAHALGGVVGGTGSPEWGVLSVVSSGSEGGGTGKLYAHLETSQGSFPSAVTDGIEIASDTWYWITVQYNQAGGKAYLSVYDTSLSQIGSTIEGTFRASPPTALSARIGQNASEDWSGTGYSYWDNAMIDWTRGTFPLLPTVTETHSGSSSVSGGGAIESAGRKQASGASSVSAAGAIATLGVAAMLGMVSVSGGGGISASGHKAASAAASASASGGVSSSGRKEARSAIAVSGAGAISSTGHELIAGEPVAEIVHNIFLRSPVVNVRLKSRVQNLWIRRSS